MPTNIWYTVDDEDYRHEMELDFVMGEGESGILAAAEFAAEDFHAYHDDGGAIWPVSIRIFKSPDGKCCGTVSVDLEMEPSFYGVLVQPAEPTGEGEP